MKLFRPVGFKELDLILNTGNRRFPPRLPSQPIFYPVLNSDYATQIAKDWNTKDKNSNYAGYVTEFEVEDDYISSFEIRQVGSSIHQEFWIPSEELDEFNHNILKNILIIDAYYGEEYVGESSIDTPLKDKTYIEQLVYLKKLKELNLMDYMCEVLSQWKIITQNYLLWSTTDFSGQNIQNSEKEMLLQSMKRIMKDNIKWFIEQK